MATELAVGYVSLVPSARGITSAVSRELTGPTARVASEAGANASKSYAKSFGSGLKKVGIGVAVGLAVAGVAAVKFGKDFVAAAEESRKVGNQTNAVLKSTGSIAGISATGVGKLATALSMKSGIDDELIQSGANLLLTFTKVRNETGKGNDIFNQGVAIANDMSVALGQDMKSSVIQLGKALNDPLKGMTALQRVGVTFDKQQKKQIKDMVEHGNVLGAQKVILRELTTEFGGSAAAQATASGKLKVALGNVAETIGGALLPVIDRAATFIQAALPRAVAIGRAAFARFRLVLIAVGNWWSTNGPKITAVVADVFGAIRDWVKDVVPPIRAWVKDVLGDLGRWWDDHGHTIVGIATALGVAIGTLAVAGMRTAQFLVRNWSKIWPIFKKVAVVIGTLAIPAIIRLGVVSAVSAAKQAAAWVVAKAGPISTAAVYVAQTAIMVARWVFLGVQSLLAAAKVAAAWLISLGPIGLVIAAVAAAAIIIIKNWDTIKRFVTAAAKAVVGFLQRNWPLILAILTGPIGLAVLAIVKNWDKITGAFRAGLAFIVGAWKGAWNAVWNALQATWRTITTFLTALPGRILGYFKTAATWLYTSGKNILQGVLNGIGSVWTKNLGPWFSGLPSRIGGYFNKAATWLVTGGKNILSGMLDGITQKVGDIKKWFTDLPGKILDWMKFWSPPHWAIEAGWLTVEGFLRGLKSHIGDVRKWLGKQVGNLFTVPNLGQNIGGFKALGKKMAAAYGWTGGQWAALVDLWSNESGWNPSAFNKSSGATGIPQALPASKMGPTAQLSNANVMQRAAAQIAWGLRYIKDRYGSPKNALAEWSARSPNWYEKGAWSTRDEWARLHRGEMVLPRAIASSVRASLAGGPSARSAGPAVTIGEVNVYDGVDMDLLTRRLEFSVAGGRL